MGSIALHKGAQACFQGKKHLDASDVAAPTEFGQLYRRVSEVVLHQVPSTLPGAGVGLPRRRVSESQAHMIGRVEVSVKSNRCAEVSRASRLSHLLRHSWERWSDRRGNIPTCCTLE